MPQPLELVVVMVVVVVVVWDAWLLFVALGEGRGVNDVGLMLMMIVMIGVVRVYVTMVWSGESICCTLYECMHTWILSIRCLNRFFFL